MAAEKWPEATRKLEESLRLERAPGTAFNLGECFEKTGRTASAWAAFLEVAALSRAANRPDREQIARERAKALEPKLTRIVIAVPPASRVPGLSVTRNGETIGEAQWGSPLPVDPGELLIRATSPGKIPWDTRLTTAGEGKTITAEVPLLEQDLRVEPPVIALPPPTGGSASQLPPSRS